MSRPVAPVRARRAAAILVALSALALAGCNSDDGQTKAADQSPDPKPSPTAPAVTLSTNVDGGKPVAVDKVIKVSSQHGSMQKVAVRAGKVALPGKLSKDGTSWKSTGRLEPGLRYHVRTVSVDADGRRADVNTSFKTEYLPLDRQTFPSFAPLQGETVGVGMPVIVHFDVPVTNRASIERHLSVQSTPEQTGTWHWVSSTEVHWRPRTYWKPGTDVTVTADINSVPAGGGVYGQLNRSVSFHVGDAIISKVNIATHHMKVYENGRLLRTVAISAGKPGFITRSGTKVIIEKERHKVMDAATIGIKKSSPNYYKLDVYWAMRVTYSGEFLHAAPWSTSSQGVANVSHGCVGMTTENARWLFNLTHNRGDVVEVTGSNRYMTLDNGYGDWNASFKQYAEGSALS